MPIRRVLRESVAQLAFLFLPGRREGVNMSCSAREVPATHCPSCCTVGSLPCQQVLPLHPACPKLIWEPSSPESEENPTALSGTSLKLHRKNGKRFLTRMQVPADYQSLGRLIDSPECKALFKKTNKQYHHTCTNVQAEFRAAIIMCWFNYCNISHCAMQKDHLWRAEQGENI